MSKVKAMTLRLCETDRKKLDALKQLHCNRTYSKEIAYIIRQNFNDEVLAGTINGDYSVNFKYKGVENG